MRLKDKVAIITGAADLEGIGAAIALRYAKEGAKLVIADLKDGGAVVAAVRNAGGEAEFVKADVTNQEECDAMARLAAERFGSVDILVNNAAIYADLLERPFTEISTRQWNRVMEVNAGGPFHCLKAVFPYMRDRGGKVINIASDTIMLGVPGLAHYVSSKGAIFAFTRCIAKELGEYNITVNSLAPGYTKSGASKKVQSASTLCSEEEFDKFVSDMRCLKRAQFPEDLAGAAVFLASEDSAFITGQLIAVNGGMAFS